MGHSGHPMSCVILIKPLPALQQPTCSLICVHEGDFMSLVLWSAMGHHEGWGSPFPWRALLNIHRVSHPFSSFLDQAYEIRCNAGVPSKFSFAQDIGILSFHIQIDTPMAIIQQKAGIPWKPNKTSSKKNKKNNDKMNQHRKHLSLIFSDLRGRGGREKDSSCLSTQLPQGSETSILSRRAGLVLSPGHCN